MLKIFRMLLLLFDITCKKDMVEENIKTDAFLSYLFILQYLTIAQ